MRYPAKGTKAAHLLTVSCALAFAVGLQIPGANAQGTVLAAAVGPKQQAAPAMRSAGPTVAAPKGDQYYVEFRSRYAQSYGHAFGLEHALKTLVLTPVVTGVSWYKGFDHPDMFGRVKKKGKIVGGHEFLVVGIDVEEKLVRACNSWGPDWGDGGYFTFSWAAWELLLDQDGDVTTATPGRPKPKHGWKR